MMRYIRSIKALLSEPGWFKKIIIPGLFCLVPIFGLIHLLGWGAEILREKDRRSITVLPEDSLSFIYLMDGFRIAVGVLFYNIPSLFFYWLKILAVRSLADTGTPVITVLLRITSLIFGFLSYVFILLFLITLPLFLKIFIKRPYGELFLYRQVFRQAPGSIHELMCIAALLFLLLVFSTLGISILVVGICFTLPAGLAAYLSILGDSDFFLLTDSYGL